ncbi:MAG: hypothetical protein ACHBN1_14935 [Heteroscytonema crispum UTEX LB 1556]
MGIRGEGEMGATGVGRRVWGTISRSQTLAGNALPGGSASHSH